MRRVKDWAPRLMTRPVVVYREGKRERYTQRKRLWFVFGRWGGVGWVGWDEERGTVAAFVL